jgi:hypothetical protein
MTSLLRRNTSNLVTGLCCLIPDLKPSEEKSPPGGWALMR